MTAIRLPGVKSYLSKGRRYYYVSGLRVVDSDGKPVDPETDPTRFALCVSLMQMNLKKRSDPAPHKAACLGGLIELFCGAGADPDRTQRVASPEWQQLAPATRKSYGRVLDPKTGYLCRAVGMPLAQIALTAVDKANVLRMRNRIDAKFGFWTANYSVRVLSRLFAWAVLYGHMSTNPALRVPALHRPSDLQLQHRSWSDAEFSVVVSAARQSGESGVVLALHLARYAGWALGDIANQPSSVWRRPRLQYVRRKTRRRGQLISLPAPDRLLAVLDEFAPPSSAPTLVMDSAGKSYSEARMRQALYRLTQRLVAAGKVQPGLTIHGLRHSLGKELYDLGLERDARKAVLGHESDAAAKVYERDGERAKQASHAVQALNRLHSGEST